LIDTKNRITMSKQPGATPKFGKPFSGCPARARRRDGWNGVPTEIHVVKRRFSRAGRFQRASLIAATTKTPQVSERSIQAATMARAGTTPGSGAMAAIRQTKRVIIVRATATGLHSMAAGCLTPLQLSLFPHWDNSKCSPVPKFVSFLIPEEE
jgi:hypothetical protein